MPLTVEEKHAGFRNEALAIMKALKSGQLNATELGLQGVGGNMTSLRLLLSTLAKLGIVEHTPALTRYGRLVHAYGLPGWDYSTKPPKPPSQETKARLLASFEQLLFGED